jgi:hypothetical protein
MLQVSLTGMEADKKKKKGKGKSKETEITAEEEVTFGRIEDLTTEDKEFRESKKLSKDKSLMNYEAELLANRKQQQKNAENIKRC